MTGGREHTAERPFSKEVPTKDRPPSSIFIQPKKPDFVLDLGGERVGANPRQVVIDMAGTEAGRNRASDFSLQLGEEMLEENIPEVVIDLVGGRENPLWEFKVVPEADLVTSDKTAKSEVENLVTEIEELKGRLLEKDSPIVTSTLEQSVYKNAIKYNQPKVTSTLEQYEGDGPLVVSTLEQQLYEGSEGLQTEDEAKYDVIEEQPYFGRSPLKTVTGGQQADQKPNIESTLEQASYEKFLSGGQGKTFTYEVIPVKKPNVKNVNEVPFTSTLEQHQKSAQFNRPNGLFKIEDNPVKVLRVENPSTIYGHNEVDLVSDLPQRAEVLDSFDGGRLLQTSGLVFDVPSLSNSFTEDPSGSPGSFYDLVNTSEDLIVSLVDGEETHPWYHVLDDHRIPAEDNSRLISEQEDAAKSKVPGLGHQGVTVADEGVMVMKEDIQVVKDGKDVLTKDKKEEVTKETESTMVAPVEALAPVEVPAPVEVVGDAGYLVKYQYGQQQPASTGDLLLLEAPGDPGGAGLQQKSKNSQLPVRFPQQEDAVQDKNQHNFVNTKGQHSQLNQPGLNPQELVNGERNLNTNHVGRVDLARIKDKARVVEKENTIHEENKFEDESRVEQLKTDEIEKDTGRHYTYTVQQYFDTPYQSTSYYLSNKKHENPVSVPDVKETPRGFHPKEDDHDAGKESNLEKSPILSSIGETFTGETYVARSHGETRPRQGIAPAGAPVTNGGGIGANKLTTSGISGSTGGPIQILSKLIFPSDDYNKDNKSSQKGEASPTTTRTREMPEQIPPKANIEYSYNWRRQKDPPETDYNHPPAIIEKATSQERPETGHSGLYAYEDWMAQAVRSMENYLNSEDKQHSEVEKVVEDNKEKILYKMVDGAYQRTLLRKDDAEVRRQNIFVRVKVLFLLIILFTGLIHPGLTHTCANDEVPGLQKD